MNGSINGGGITRLPRRRPLRVALATEDTDAAQRLRFALALVRVRSGLLWSEVAPEALEAGDICLRYGDGPTPEDAHAVQIPSDRAAVDALFRVSRPALGGVEPAGPRRWTLGTDLPGFIWTLGQPSHGQLSLRDRVQVQPTLDVRHPWLDDAAERLTEALLAAAAPDVELHVLPPFPGGASWGLALSHDVDYVTTPLRYRGTRAYYFVRGIKRRLGRPLPLARHYTLQATAPLTWRHRATMAAERDHGVQSDWFIFVRRPGNEQGRQAILYNPRYRLDDPGVRRFVEDLRADGQRVGLHASPEAGESLDQLLDEKHALEAISGTPARGLRHHLGAAVYPAAARQWAQAGFEYDSTVIINHEQGYRIGTAAPLPLAPAGVPELIEVAPNWMDTTAFNCLGLTPEQLGRELLERADAARERHALEGVVWHDVPMTRANREDRLYRTLLSHIQDRGGLVAAPGRFAEHARGLLDSRLAEDGDGVELHTGAGLEANAVVVRAAASARSFAALRDGSGDALPLEGSAALNG